jgi:transcriptional regulator with XRE-family HTH domain
MEKLLQKIGEKIREIRQSYNWLQRELAEHANIPVRSLGRIERGEVDVRIGTLQKIAKALNKKVKDLMP